jgi:anti-sigma factor RsiW
MNCQDFPTRLLEYLDEDLYPWTRLAADRHLARCDRCRRTLDQERQLARSLSRQFERATDSLTVDAEMIARIDSALAKATAHRSRPASAVGLWNRFAVPIAVVGILGVGAVLLAFFGTHSPLPGETRKSNPTQSPISIQASYMTPQYTFKREGDFVIDALAFGTNAVDATLWVLNRH